jgi:hypothetical protein
VVAGVVAELNYHHRVFPYLVVVSVVGVVVKMA